jgi:predicted dienelactone hydrolase
MSATTPARGALVSGSAPAKIQSVSVADMQSMMSGDSSATTQFLQSVLTFQCSIDIYRLQYQTVGGQNEPTTASAALMVPTGSGSQCQGARPIAMYAHGTNDDKAYNIADVRNNAEGILIAAAFAARGYIVVAPNYAGYDTSTLTYHPYLNADQQSKDMIDALTAARTSLPMINQNVTDSGKLFVTGYSQGGYVAMATHRALQAAGQTVTASAPMSGPYALAAFGDAIFQGRVTNSGPLNVTLLATSYQRAYGNIYTNLSDIYEAQYANGIDMLLPSTVGVGTLYAQGKLPRDQLFNSTPPDPMFANITPATDPANLATIFAKGFGPNNLVTNSYRLAALQDAQTMPDGGFPTVTTGLPADSPGNSLRQALKRNDLRNWAPNAPTLLCAGNSDPTVLYFNTQLMQNYWTTNPPPAPVTILDIDSDSTPNDPFGSFKNGFTVAKDVIAATAVIKGAKDGGQAAVLDAYHATLVAPFCLAAVASFFDGM